MDPPLRERWDLKGNGETETRRVRVDAAQRSVRHLMERRGGSRKSCRAQRSQRKAGGTLTHRQQRKRLWGEAAATLGRSWWIKSICSGRQEFTGATKMAQKHNKSTGRCWSTLTESEMRQNSGCMWNLKILTESKSLCVKLSNWPLQTPKISILPLLWNLLFWVFFKCYK